MRLNAFAKINWSLDITGEREDGYHLMDMLMQPISLADEIHLSQAEGIQLTTGGYPPCKADEKNLAYRAAAALKKATGCSRGALIHVEKQIPIGAGLGGGSADAATVLFGLNRLWALGLTQAELESIGLTLGADVPFCLRGGLTRTRGIGEQLVSVPNKYCYWLLVVQPCRGLRTGDVFQLWQDGPEVRHPNTDAAENALREGQLTDLCASIGNVLEPIASRLRPEISQAIQELQKAGTSRALMTGSGSAVFGVFQSSALAEKAYRQLRARWRSVFLCHTQQDSIRVLNE